MRNLLVKLEPLQRKNNKIDEIDEIPLNRASLSLLEVFLKKYRIQTF
jgi:hypothetical protein